MPKIYESPDGGKTIREREFGDYTNTITIADPSTFDDNGSWTSISTGTITLHDPWQEQQERTMLIDKYPELKDKWEEYKELEKHYKAWDLLYNK